MSNRSHLAAVGAITLTSVLWGTTGTAATFAASAGPLAIGAAALGIGGLLQAAVALPALRRERAHILVRRRVVLGGAAAVAVYPLAFYSSMHLAGVAVGTVVSLASAPLASGVLEFLLRGDRLGPWWRLSALLGVTGSVLLCADRATVAAGGAGRTALGIAAGLIAGITYACYSWAARELMTTGVSRAASMGSIFGLGGALLVPVLIATGAPLLESTTNVAVTTYMALVPMFLGYLLFGYGLARVSASTATTITLSEPAVAAILAVAVVGETLSPVGWTGLGILALVLLILALAPRPGPEAALQL